MLCYVIFLLVALLRWACADSQEHKMKMDIQKKKWTAIYDKMGVNWGFSAYMRMYRETEKLIET